MDELRGLLSFAWRGTKKDRYTLDKWSLDDNCRKLSDSESRANALLTGNRQLDSTRHWKLVAVDLDKKDNWSEVVDTYKALSLPPTLTSATPGGGYHLLFWVPKGVIAQNINDNRHCKHFELKGDGGNITAPGSVFECGSQYQVVRDVPIAHLMPHQAYSLCKVKKSFGPRPTMLGAPDGVDVEEMAKYIDERARRNERGWMLRCPHHDDRRASAILFDSGWMYCSGCGYNKMLVRKTALQR